MKKFEGMLFCTDLDGTLYDDNKTVSKKNLDAIEYFKNEGGLFTFITGRPPYISKDVYNLIKPNAPFGCINGGGIYDGEANNYLWNVELPDTVIEVVKEIDKKLPEISVMYNAKKCVYFYKDNSASKRHRELTGLENMPCYHYEDIKEPVLKIVFAHQDEKQILALAELLNNHKMANDFSFTRSERAFYELLPKGVSKGAALYKMAELLNVDIKKTIAVGDYNNDASMIKAAGIGFAVKNAVNEAKAAADYITVSNNEDAIYKIVEGLDKGIFTL